MLIFRCFSCIFRLTPSYLFVLLFFMGLAGHIWDGPFSRMYQKNPSFTSCQEYWWTNIIYINNFKPSVLAEQVNVHQIYCSTNKSKNPVLFLQITHRYFSNVSYKFSISVHVLDLVSCR